jgi:hypothetical protein
MNDVLSDAVYRLDQGVLCFQNDEMFYCGLVNIISFTPIRIVQLSTAQIFMELKKYSTALCAGLIYRISAISDNKCGHYGCKYIDAVSKIRVSMH